MLRDYDLVVRRGTVFDGVGADPVEADVAIRNGRIAAVGRDLAAGIEEIDATGLLVTPGFVDPHTHYDGQATWESRLVPSSAHGVTTAVIGNCGVGFAPCRPDQHDLLIRLMEGVEDIPHPVLAEGLPWTWESFPEYLDHLAGRQYDMDIGAYVPHAPLRVFVMGERAVELEQATGEDLRQMDALVREALMAGALGVATSRTLFHRSSDGRSIPTLKAGEDELEALLGAMTATGRGILQMTGDTLHTPDGIEQMLRLSAQSGRRITFSFGSTGGNEQCLEMMEKVLHGNRSGSAIYPQILPRAVGVLLSFGLTLNPFSHTPSYARLTGLPLDRRIAELRKSDVRSAILSEAGTLEPGMSIASYVQKFDTMFLLGDPPDYEQPLDQSIAARAARQGIDPSALAYDLLLERDGQAYLYLAMANYNGGNLDMAEMILRYPDTIAGLGDGGAHCATICDGSYSTFLLAHFSRDRKRGALMPIAESIRKLTSAPAAIVGLNDRGRIAPGYKADLNIIDFDRLRVHAPTIRHDLPSGGKRLVQQAEGYRATIVNGVPVYRDGEATGTLPGRLVRGAQPAPAPRYWFF